MPTVKENLEKVLQRIDEAAIKSGRSSKDISLVAVTKGILAERILEARAEGISRFAENRVQEAQTKIPLLNDPNLQWHMIGHLQTNKISSALPLFSLIQSIDSVRLAREINKASQEAGKITDCLLEVNISGEKQKFGFGPEEIYRLIEEMADLTHVRAKGLMGMAPNTADAQLRRLAFKKLRGIFNVCKAVRQDNLEMKILSMGMSDDFEIAIEEGSNMVRLGRALFR